MAGRFESFFSSIWQRSGWQISARAAIAFLPLFGCSVPSLTNVTPERLASGQMASAAVGNQFSTGLEPVAIVLTPNGGHLYTANLLDGTLSGFAVQLTGAISAASGSPFQAGLHPVALCVTTDGRFLYVAN